MPESSTVERGTQQCSYHGPSRAAGCRLDLAMICLSLMYRRCLASAAVDVDFIVLEGMGRSIETNLNARLTCDALKIGVVKHPEVAAALGGRMLDCVVQFDSTPKN